MSMTQPILIFFVVFLLLGGVSSSTDDAMSAFDSDSGPGVATVSSNVPEATTGATAAPIPDTATVLLTATGLIGLAAISRRKN